MSLLEVVVSIAMFSSVILATVTTFDATGQATVALGHRATAVELASSALEEMRAAPFDRLGLSPGADGYTERFEGNETVAVSGALITPRSETRRGTTTFTTLRNVTWSAVTMSNGRRVPAAVKLLTVVVSWRDPLAGGRGADMTVRLQSARAANGPVAPCLQRSVDVAPGPLRGVVNLYVPGSADSAAGATVVAIDPAALRGSGIIAAGDLLVVMQVGGANAGRYEYALATSQIVGGHLGVSGVGAGGGLALGYSAADLFQVIRVPTYGDATIDGVTAAPWDGRSGGVAAMDVAGTATLSGNRSPSMSASGAGFDAPAPSGVIGAADRLVMGGVPGARGRSGSVGGGIVLLRATAVAAMGRLSAGGHGAADGGSVGLFVENGDLDSVDVEARGAGASTTGGLVLANADLRSVANDAAGRPGTTRIPTSMASLTGIGLGVGCEPALSIDVATTTPTLAAAPGAVATWTVRVSNSRAEAKALVIDLVAPLGWRLLGGSTMRSVGGATRTPIRRPAPGDVPASWGVLNVPAGGSASLTASFRVPAGTPPGTYSPLVTARYTSPSGNLAATFPGDGSAADDVTVAP
ncbi:MAG: hypothetical protein IT195_07080 [Microthrixaceae bacterium]|nr:hypothetical protein [Microthrixaceae bacterium]